MAIPYAKVIVKGSPITKSNFKLHNAQGRAILPSNTGKSYDKYANYEQEIAYEARIQNPNIVLEESLIAVLKVYYKSDKRHPERCRRKNAENYLQMIKTEYPHRFFILKRITQNPEFWEIALHDNYYIISEEAYI